jgi:hypothetical protein
MTGADASFSRYQGRKCVLTGNGKITYIIGISGTPVGGQLSLAPKHIRFRGLYLF